MNLRSRINKNGRGRCTGEGRVNSGQREEIRHLDLESRTLQVTSIVCDKCQYTKLTHENWIYFISYCQTCNRI